jgi:hypothetical protein
MQVINEMHLVVTKADGLSIVLPARKSPSCDNDVELACAMQSKRSGGASRQGGAATVRGEDMIPVMPAAKGGPGKMQLLPDSPSLSTSSRMEGSYPIARSGM